jgi:hypothetical protein
MCLAKGVPDVVLVEKMKDIDTHPDIQEPRPLVWVRQNLLFSITICVIYEMFWLVRSRDRE